MSERFNPLPHPEAEIHPAMGSNFRQPPEPEGELPFEVIDPPDFEYECWCGAKGKYSELCDPAALRQPCGGSGVVQCFCGGDLCVCHHHGEAECLGCEDCEEKEAEGDF